MTGQAPFVNALEQLRAPAMAPVQAPPLPLPLPIEVVNAVLGWRGDEEVAAWLRGVCEVMVMVVMVLMLIVVMVVAGMAEVGACAAVEGHTSINATALRT